MGRFVAVVLAGGSGQRFWPLSTPERPKQFLDLEARGRSLLQATCDRLAPLCGGPSGILVVTGERYASLVRAQLPDVPAEQVLLEPLGRDTAPAIALAALEVHARFGNVSVGVFPSDHRVDDLAAFVAAVRRAADLGEAEGGIVTLGMRPDRPATGYGYLEVGAPVGGGPGHRLARFVEKPDLETAHAYLASGRFLWNAGIFVAPVPVLLEELERHAPEVLEPLAAAHRSATVHAVYPALPKRSIDYAVMEHTDRAYVVPAAFGWDDLGDWVALERLRSAAAHDGAGADANVVVGRHVGVDTAGSIVYNDGAGVIVTVGVRDVVVVRRGDHVLLVAKDQVQQLKRALEHPDLSGARPAPVDGAATPPGGEARAAPLGSEAAGAPLGGEAPGAPLPADPAGPWE